MQNLAVTDGIGELANTGLTRVPGTFATPEDAWRPARQLVAAAAENSIDDAPIEVIGNFVIPPLDNPRSRDFQTLHFDFGVPLAPGAPTDVARFTALHVPAAVTSAQAITRFVPLRPLLSALPWPDHDELVRRVIAYGENHGARELGNGYVEGSLARIIEAALGESPVLPSVRSDPDYLCGTEFSTLADETSFFNQRGLLLDDVVIEVCLQPGDLLLFDNLTLAHGRRGSRAPGELHQRVFGHKALQPREQTKLRDLVLAAFAG